MAIVSFKMLLILSILLQFLCGSVLGGSCREAKLCCTGRDSSCVVQKAPINAIIEDLSDKPCYCDHACLKLGDCCSDFKDACGGYEDLNKRKETRESAWRSPGWDECVAYTVPLIREMHCRVMVPTEFSPTQ